VLLIVSWLAVSCASSSGTTSRGLTGEWRYADATQSCQYTFTADGNFRGSVALAGKKVSQFTGRWRIEGNRLMYLYTGDALGRSPVGATDEDKLVAVAPDHFEIEAADGSHRTYRRIH
jgi:hypothetical protein